MLYGQNKYGYLFYHDQVKWNRMSGLAIDISVIRKDEIWIIGKDFPDSIATTGYVYKSTDLGKTWVRALDYYLPTHDAVETPCETAGCSEG